jgi:diguanylate cyclase (GGDEF)-like protein
LNVGSATTTDSGPDHARRQEAVSLSRPNDPVHLLIIDSDEAAARQMGAVIAGEEGKPESWRSPSGAPRRARLCTVRHSLRALMDENLSLHDLVICAMELSDGTGIDALGFVRGARPDLPVVLISASSDPALMVESVRCGALDCIVHDEATMDRLSVCIEKWLAQREQSAESERSQRKVNQSLTDLLDEITKLHGMIAQLESVATTDELTGLSNRRRLNFALDQHWQKRRGTSDSIAFLMIDVDQFKRLNDEYGHQRGDALLRLLGRVLHENCRETDVIARYGGDEFCVLMPHATVENAAATARRICDSFQRAASQAFPSTLVTLSIGIAHTSLSDPQHALELVAHADEAMYTAKRSADRVMARRRDGMMSI